MPNLEDQLKQVKSVSDQLTSTLSSPIKTFNGAVDGFLKSQPTSIGEAVNNVSVLASQFGKLGLSAITSVTQSINQLSNIGTYTKFKDTFIPPQTIVDRTPEEISEENASINLTDLKYPNDLGERFITFTILGYERKAPLRPKTDLPKRNIYLPIPSNLQEAFNMSYSDSSLGITGLVGEGAIAPIIKAINEGNKDIAFNASQELGAGTGGIAGIAQYAARSAISGLSENIGKTVDSATGTVLNPYQSLIFQGVNLRAHSFTYKFSPNNEKEAQILKEIIRVFKEAMHPQQDKLFLQFPDTFDIKFNPEDKAPYFFKTCFLESMSLNYAPSNTPAFFKGSSIPVEVDITLNFKEIKPIQRIDFNRE